MINRATLMGRIGKKEQKTVKNGNSFTVLSIATARKWKDQSGQLKEETTWHPVYCFGRLAEIALKYAHVGQIIYVEGEINNRKQETGNGDTKYFYSINCNELKLIPGQKKPENNQGNKKSFIANGHDDFDDSVPF